MAQPTRLPALLLLLSAPLLSWTLLAPPAWAAPVGTVLGRVEFSEELRSLFPRRDPATLYLPTPTVILPSLEEAVVYLERVPGTFAPSLKNAVSHVRGREFHPRVLTLVKGTRMVFANDDPYEHLLKSNALLNPPISFPLKPGGPLCVTRTTTPEEFVVSCPQHMRSECFILVLQNPFFTTPVKDANYLLKNVPAGRYLLKAWHPDLVPVSQEITVAAGKQTPVDLIFVKAR